MQGPRTLQSLKLQNLLSFGSDAVEIVLEPLNVLIGPNGSGKSNFIEAIRLLQATPGDLTHPIVRGGGIDAWLWKGASTLMGAAIDVVVETKDRLFGDQYKFLYGLSLSSYGARLRIDDEKIVRIEDKVVIYDYSLGRGLPYIAVYPRTNEQKGIPSEEIGKFDYNKSVLAQRSEPTHFGEIYNIADVFRNIRIYSNIDVNQGAAVRNSQSIDLDLHFLFEDASNLALVLNDLDARPGIMQSIVQRLREFNPNVEDIKTRLLYGNVQIFLEEKGLKHTVPATRLSDGTLRFLCLLTILCHPEPPPLICIEEPELGMHPDIIPTIAELLIDASRRTQLIVTTHSDLLVSCLRDVPEAIVVCERGEEGTTLRRLNPEEIGGWPEEKSLGDIWLSGAIGGTRW